MDGLKSLAPHDKVEISDSVQVSIAMALWNAWGSIAIDREAGAADKRQALHQLHVTTGSIYPYYVDEFNEALVGVSASAHALDAIYGHLANEQVRAEVKAAQQRATDRGRRFGRANAVRLCLRMRLAPLDNGRARLWRHEMAWLFTIRDSAVHPAFTLSNVVPHPSGLSEGSPLMVDYSSESCKRAVDLMLDVLDLCTTAPAATDFEMTEWAKSYRPAFLALRQRRTHLQQRANVQETINVESEKYLT